MFKLVGAACATLLLLAAYSQRESFTKYKAVEAYEVQPGILAFPNYTEEGLVCEIGIERNHYSPEIIQLDSGLSREEIEKTVDELAPAAVRGQKWDSPLNGLMTITGRAMTTSIEYEQVTVQIYSAVIGDSKKKTTVENVAAVIKWKKRKCKLASRPNA
jgi:hypothetical protein